MVVDTDIASFIFKWHPEFASRYIEIVRGSELILSFMTIAEMRQGALDANWGAPKRDALDPTWPISRYSSPIAFSARHGLRFETRAGGRDVQWLRPIRGSQPLQ